jgi:hypothetical protein
VKHAAGSSSLAHFHGSCCDCLAAVQLSSLLSFCLLLLGPQAGPALPIALLAALEIAVPSSALDMPACKNTWQQETQLDRHAVHACESVVMWLLHCRK